MRARVTLTVLAFFAALAATTTPPTPAAAAAAERAQTLGGETERAPYVASPHAQLQLGAMRPASPGHAKLPPLAFALDLDATLTLTQSPRAIDVARAPIAPPSAPRSCRGPPRA